MDDDYYINRYIPRKDWLKFKRALEDAYGSTYGIITEHVRRAMLHYAEHFEKHEYDKIGLKEKSQGRSIKLVDATPKQTPFFGKDDINESGHNNNKQ